MGPKYKLASFLYQKSTSSFVKCPTIVSFVSTLPMNLACILFPKVPLTNSNVVDAINWHFDFLTRRGPYQCCLSWGLLPLLVVPFWAKKSQKGITGFGVQRVTRRELHSRITPPSCTTVQTIPGPLLVGRLLQDENTCYKTNKKFTEHQASTPKPTV